MPESFINIRYHKQICSELCETKNKSYSCFYSFEKLNKNTSKEKRSMLPQIGQYRCTK